MTRLWPWLFAGLFLGGIAHLVSILILPSVSRQDATSILRALGPVNALLTLPRSQPQKSVIPFGDPNAAVAICPFDITAMPLRIRAPAGDTILTLTFMQGGGGIFYSLSDKANLKGALDVRLATDDQLQTIEANDPEDQTITELRIRAPRATGVVLIRAISSEAALYQDAERRVAAASCAPEPIQ